MKELCDKRMKDVCRCEDLRCGEQELKHFEECTNCGSTAYHTTVKSFKDEEDGNKDTEKHNVRY